MAESASPQAPSVPARLASVLQVRQLERGGPALAREPAAPRSVQLALEHALEPQALPGESAPGRTVSSLRPLLAVALAPLMLPASARRVPPLPSPLSPP